MSKSTDIINSDITMSAEGGIQMNIEGIKMPKDRLPTPIGEPAPLGGGVGIVVTPETKTDKAASLASLSKTS